MFSRVRIAIRFFFVGLAVGVLLAPRSGEETRRLVREKADRLLNDVLDAATLGTYESGSAEATAPPKRARSGNGSGSRTRSTTSTSSEPAASEAGV
ncbi:MAG TPA: YtxH domain-containing protein [Candidatus Limnocylindria bacterium]|nr:YtxH domain-containing protein [Candidatus Limnocylindria bacterium]